MSEELITVNVPAWQADMRRLSQTCAGLSGRLGVGLPKIIRREMGLLSRDLIDLSPPEDRDKTADMIEKNTLARFGALENYTGNIPSAKHFDPKKAHGSGSVMWLIASPKSLVGLDQQMDFRKATVDEIVALRWKITKGGRTIVGRRGKQKVYLIRKTTTKAATVKKAIAKMKDHIGRFKAYWMVTWLECGSPGRKLPGYVEKHEGMAREFGSVKNELGVQMAPAMTAINRGPGSKLFAEKSSYFVKRAVDKRISSIFTKVQILIKYPEKVAEEYGDD